LSPTDLFFSLRTEAWHFLHRVAWRAFLAPQRRQTFRKRRRFWAICFLVTSAIGISRIPSQAVQGPLKDFSSLDMTSLRLQTTADTEANLTPYERKLQRDFEKLMSVLLVVWA